MTTPMHHDIVLENTTLHYVTAGATGSPILLVHGFPETWWTFHHVIPHLAAEHRVIAVDLRGFGASSHDGDDFSSAADAEDLHQLIDRLGMGPVHIAAQDVSGGAVFRLAHAHPEDLVSLTGTEMGLAGFGLEALADVTHGGSWHIGVLAAPGIPEMLLAGKEREFLTGWAFRDENARGTVAEQDVTEFAQAYAGEAGWRGAAGLYRSLLAEGDELRDLAAAEPLTLPCLAIGASGGPFTATTLDKVSATPAARVELDGVGHYVALEAPDRFASALLGFVEAVDGRTPRRSADPVQEPANEKAPGQHHKY